MLENLIKKVFGSQSDKEIKKIIPLVEKINSLNFELENISDGEIIQKSEQFRSVISKKVDSARKDALEKFSDIDQQKKTYSSSRA